MLKICNKCHEENPDTIEFFSFRIRVIDSDGIRKDLLNDICKKCRREYNRLLRLSKGIKPKVHYTKEEKRKKDVQRKLLKRKMDLNTRVRDNLRTRLYVAIKNEFKSGSAVGDLGCSIQEFRNYIADRFKPGMSWNNWGKWHLDHIIPLASFDLTDRSQFLKAVNYTNYQPLWALENLSKSDKIR